MNLMHGTIRPGTILSVFENGNVVASSPGLFSSQDQANLPPIMPWWQLCGIHSNGFSQPKVGDEIWILHCKDNPRQMFWFRKDDKDKANAEIIKEGNVEVLCNREAGLGYATIYFSDGSGWVIRNDESRLQIFPDGHIELGMKAPHRTIRIDNDAICLGDGEYSAVYGEELVDILSKFCGMLQAVASAAKTNPYTISMGNIMTPQLKELEGMIPGILSTHIKLD